MVSATRLNGKELFVNPDLISFIEETSPTDTLITLTDGLKIVVSERPDTIITRIIEYRKKTFERLPVLVTDGNKGGA